MAPLNSNTDYQQIINQAMSQLSALGVNGGTKGASSSENNYVNSVWGLVQNGQAAVEGEDGQKAAAITNIVNGLMDMLTKLGTGEAAKANKEVRENDKKVRELDSKANEAVQNTESKVQEIVNQIAQNTSDITKALETIQELGGDKGAVAEAQAQLEEQLAVVETNQKILNDKDAKPEEKQAALQAITGAAAIINGLVESVMDMQSKIQEQNGVVETASNNVAGLVENAAEVVTTGIQNVQSNIQSGQGLFAKETTTATTGAINEATGKAATSAGQALSSNFVTASQGAKLIMTGSDQSMAGQTRIQGSAANLAALTKSIGQMGSDLSSVANFTNSIGQVAGGVSDLVGQYDAALPSVITATGSWTQVADANAQLEQAIAEYAGQESETQQFNFDTNLFKQAFEMQQA